MIYNYIVSKPEERKSRWQRGYDPTSNRTTNQLPTKKGKDEVRGVRKREGEREIEKEKEKEKEDKREKENLDRILVEMERNIIKRKR